MTAIARCKSEYDGFLFTIVAESHDVPISVASIMLRLGIDPWSEAARLTQLPSADAIASLSATIRKLRSISFTASEADKIATGLIGRLPTREALVAQTMRQEAMDLSSIWMIFAIFIGMMLVTQSVPKPHDDVPARAVAIQQDESAAPYHGRMRKPGPTSAPAARIPH